MSEFLRRSSTDDTRPPCPCLVRPDEVEYDMYIPSKVPYVIVLSHILPKYEHSTYTLKTEKQVQLKLKAQAQAE